jgi:hypothetical protein
MRRSSISALLVMSALVACKAPGKAPPPTVGPKNEAKMTLTCLDDGTLSFSLSRWAITLVAPNGDFVLINDPSSNADAQITADDAALFGGQKFTARHGAGAVPAKPVAGTLPKTYKYSITVTCPGPNGPVTTPIDPDMIIPWKTTQ